MATHLHGYLLKIFNPGSQQTASKLDKPMKHVFISCTLIMEHLLRCIIFAKTMALARPLSDLRAL